ncbi:ABC transporter ATP-binding protein [uncultured Cohaesibacter sp.]|uniref:ABC transporter ATP-binding protein n=1 Tax=uncultured Cohaesibacter sp. TaxID=1002546 RepID=UPI0029C63F25|nr:ABC transporter ATP-binding protein [uncultured Cohaesibacter sp.]
MILDIRDVHTRFLSRDREVHAVQGISFAMSKEEVTGIVGESGSGKSTLINTILGLQRGPMVRSSGSAQFDGQDLMQMPDRALRRLRGKEIGYIAQNPFGALNPILRISKQFEVLVRAHGGLNGRKDRRVIRASALDLLARVGIPTPERVYDGHAHELSGGMAQRVVIAMSLMLDPQLVIADEPTTALDMTVQKQIMDLISGLAREQGRSMLIITHDLGVVANYCDSVVVMCRGRMVERGTVHEVFANPSDPYTRNLLDAGRAKTQQEGAHA